MVPSGFCLCVLASLLYLAATLHAARDRGAGVGARVPGRPSSGPIVADMSFDDLELCD
jgi:hypothetical protein